MLAEVTGVSHAVGHEVGTCVVTDEESSDEGNRKNVALWMDKPDGTVAIVGTASVKA